MSTDVATPFTWSGSGERVSADTLKRRRAVADAMIKSGTDFSPMQHWTQGMARVANALMGSYDSVQVDRDEKASAKIASANIAAMLSAAGGASADTPAAGANPVSLDATAPVSGAGGVGALATGDNSAFPASLIGNESGGNWAAQNNHAGAGGLRGHFGRLQFGQARLQDAINAGAIPQATTPQAFMSSPDLQKAAERWHFGDIDQRIQAAGYDKLIGTSVGGVPVTLNGMRAAAHLGGFGGLQRFIQSGGRSNPADANGTSLAMYMRRHGAAGGLLAGSTPLAGQDAPDDPAVAGNGPGVPLAYAGQTAAPVPAQAPGGAVPPVQPRVAATGDPGASPPQLLPDSMSRLTEAARVSPNRPVTQLLGAKDWDDHTPYFTNANGQPMTAGEAMQKMRGISPTPAAAVQRAAARVSAADLPTEGVTPLADMPAQGSKAAGFFIPPAVDGGEPTLIPTPDDLAPGAQPVQAKPGRAAVNIPPATTRVAQALNATAVRSLSDPTASDAERSIAGWLLQQQIQANKPETYTFQNIGGRLLRTGSRGSLTDTGISDTDKPTFGVIGKDEFGREQYGFINSRDGSVRPYNPPQTASSGAPSTIPPAPAGVDPKAWRDAHSKAAAEGSATGNFDQEAKLRTEYKTSLGNFEEVHDAFGRVIASTQGREDDPKAKSPAADISLVFGFMKMLDPGSVVREGEFASARNAAGVPDRIVNTYNKLLSGEFLTTEQRQDFVNQASRVYGQARRRAEETAGSYRTLSKGYGVNGDRVVTLPEGLQVPSLAPKVAPPAPTPDPTGRPAPRVVGPPQGQVARPTSDAEFTALPSGSFYVDPDDGRTYRKP